MMRIDEDVEVELSGDGSPLRFTWRGVVYGVVSSPERWIARVDWWQRTGRAPRGASAHLLELSMWRVEAVPLTTGARRVDGSFDLSVDARGRWSLVTASDEELDTRLFA
ncbi:DUF6504 family protein [Clavibacter sp. Sh2141]|jgi:hypothetical protein|uniref:DUF6504 family protein n=1 Tax=unclassified Clavibacter TaxID=2626594 RepID=UPI00278A1DD4|nr:DUF6504 family protein [Clavibacter sp. B3I6]MDQ0743223.1 hypothetical protein [Clavibacter sp. B3I6]